MLPHYIKPGATVFISSNTNNFFRKRALITRVDKDYVYYNLLFDTDINHRGGIPAAVQHYTKTWVAYPAT